MDIFLLDLIDNLFLRFHLLDLTLALIFHTKLLVGIDRAKEIQIILMSDDPIASLDNSCSLR